MWGTGYEKWEPLLLILDTMGAFRTWADEQFSAGHEGELSPELMWMLRRNNLLARTDRLIVQLRMWKMDTARAYAFARWIQQYRTDDDKTRALAHEFSELLSEAFHEAEAQWRLAGNPITPPWVKAGRGAASQSPKADEKSLSVELPPLDPIAVAILDYLSKERPLRTQVEISDGLRQDREDVGAGTKTIRPRLKKLIDLKYIEQPEGSRKGYRITTEGRVRREPFKPMVAIPEVSRDRAGH